MHPQLFEFTAAGREFEVMSYEAFLLLAALSFVGFGVWVSGRRGLDARKSFLCLIVGSFVTLISARLLHWLTHPGSFESAASVWSLQRANLSVFAGLLFGAPFTALIAARVRLQPWKLADCAAPGLAVGAMLAKAGCFLNGCCFGASTRVPWAVRLPASNPRLHAFLADQFGLPSSAELVHPVPVYEMTGALIGLLVVVWILRTKQRDGTAFLAFAAWFCLMRFVLYFISQPPPTFAAPSWLFPSIYLAIAALCTIEGVSRILLKVCHSERNEME